MSYTRPERRRLEALLGRATHLAGRIERDGAERHTFERAEFGALRWAVDQIVAARGALPKDLDRLRAALP